MSEDQNAALLRLLAEVRLGEVAVSQALEEIDQIYRFHGWTLPEGRR